MDNLSSIRNSIRNMVGGTNGQSLFTAKVLSTDGETCCVDADGLVLSDVQLRAVVNGEESGILITPKTGSYVTVADLSGDLTRIVVVGFSEVEKISIDAETDIVINGGGYGGLIKIEDLVDELNRLVQTFNSHTHVVPNGTSNAPSTLASSFSTSTLENTKVRHGE